MITKPDTRAIERELRALTPNIDSVILDVEATAKDRVNGGDRFFLIAYFDTPDSEATKYFTTLAVSGQAGVSYDFIAKEFFAAWEKKRRELLG